MDNNQNAIQVALDPNVFATTLANVSYDKENVYLMLVSGNQGRRYQFSPEHAKRLLMVLKNQIEAYQKIHGELKAEMPTSVEKTTTEQKFGFVTNYTNTP